MGNAISHLNNKTVVGWAVIFVGLVGWWVRRHLQEKKLKDQKDSIQKAKPSDRQPNQPKKDNKAKRQRMESFANESKQAQNRSYATVASTSQPKSASYSSDDGVDNRAFAQQMAQNKKNKFAPKATTEQKQKSVKQSKAKAIGENAGIEKVSSPSSTAGIDADDDQSSVTTPSVSAADPTGVSDMLEQSAPGPSVLRLTETTEKQQQKPRQSKSPQPTETKKQRQNRKKREQEKALREEEEKDRKVKMEAQRRAAREAEGRAAKDGSAFMAAQKSSAWTGGAVNGNSQQSAAATAVQPLDTFDSTTKSATATSVKTNGKENAKQNGKKPGWTEIPYSEEEQLAMLQKQVEEDEWVPVKSRKAKKGSAGIVSETDESANELPAPAATNSAPINKSAAPNGRPKAQAMPTQSSFVSLKDEGADLADDQEENEWDV